VIIWLDRYCQHKIALVSEKGLVKVGQRYGKTHSEQRPHGNTIGNAHNNEYHQKIRAFNALTITEHQRKYQCNYHISHNKREKLSCRAFKFIFQKLA